MSGKLADRATEAWSGASLHRFTLHECRHTYASFLMAAGYTLKELMEFMGHSDLQMVQRYTKLLPQPEEADPAERLDAYLDGRRRGGPARWSLDNALVFVPSTSQERRAELRSAGTCPSWTRGWSQLSAGDGPSRFVGGQAPNSTRTACKRTENSTAQSCRRRDSNPRHADYDSAALTD